MRISVLGAGLVGSAIVKDLVSQGRFELTVVDVNQQALQGIADLPVRGVEADLQTEDFDTLLQDCDLAICAVPGFMGFQTLEKIITAGKPVVDISFFPEDAFLLDALAKQMGVTAIVDCGVAPGLSNILAGYVDSQIDRIHRFVCYVGGLPVVRRWPYEYKAPFSPRDVVEEYLRPARFVENGKEVVRPALSDIEQLDFPEVGTLEAFNTDGLRTLMRTIDAPFMKEKTLRYPGHAELMRVFKDTGFFNAEPIDLDGQRVSPLALSTKLLTEHWELEQGEAEFTVMKVVVDGQRDGQSVRFVYDLFDRYDAATNTSSMARTTGYTCSIVAGLLAAGKLTQTGICPPEFIGRTPGCFEHLLSEYEKRNIHLKETVTEDKRSL